ncbi:MAG: site-2 protease family protein, partial [Lachnospiraceae bacterium]|nr:site-2 protease family protein [Lachnospiraceae bacterium]
MTIEYDRDGKTYTVTVNPKYDEEAGRYLVGFNGYGEYVECKGLNVFGYSYYEVRYAFVGTGKSLIALLTGRGSKDDVAGPIGMAQTIDEVKDAVAPYGPWVVLLNMFNIAMLLSVNLGILNMLPLPAIDGGKFMFLILEALRGRPVPPEKEGIVHLIGFALLAVLAIAVMYNDIMRIVTG